MKRDRRYNDPRASHTVNVLTSEGRGATNVSIPYKGYIISLAMDGADTCVFCDDDSRTEVIGYGVILGTSGESIKRAIGIIDMLDLSWLL